MSGKTIGILILIAVIGGASGVATVYLTQSQGEGRGNTQESTGGKAPNYEAIANVTWVKDGDTITVKIIEVTSPRQGVEKGADTIRFAGIDTVEYGKEGFDQMKNLTASLSSVGSRVYLDIDDQAHGKGPYRGYYGRLIAVVYVNKDGKWINVNAEVLREGKPLRYCKITYFKSEFNANNWLKENYPYVQS